MMSSAVLKKIRHGLINSSFSRSCSWCGGTAEAHQEVQYPRLMEVRQFVLAHNPGKAKKKQNCCHSERQIATSSTTRSMADLYAGQDFDTMTGVGLVNGWYRCSNRHQPYGEGAATHATQMVETREIETNPIHKEAFQCILCA